MIKYIGHKRAKIILKEIGQGLKRAYSSRKIAGHLFLFEGGSFNKKVADSIKTRALKNRKAISARIIKDGKFFVVYARYK